MLCTRSPDYMSTGLQVPGLAVIIVGARKDSQTYVRMKKKACEEVGIASFERIFPEDATQSQVLAAVSGFNSSPDIHGILVQLPLPRHIDEETILSAVSVEKDVDGFHPLNIGRLCMKVRTSTHKYSATRAFERCLQTLCSCY